MEDYLLPAANKINIIRPTINTATAKPIRKNRVALFLRVCGNWSSDAFFNLSLANVDILVGIFLELSNF